MQIESCFNLVQQHLAVLEELYRGFSDSFYNSNDVHSFNLKRTTISQLEANSVLFETTIKYRNKLVNYQLIDTDLMPLVKKDWPQFRFNYRTKLEDSFINKLQWYLKRDQPFYVFKSFNDFFGARLVIPDFRSFEQKILDYYVAKSDNMIVRAYIRDDSPRYHGLHLYIGSGNSKFLWEFQIWDKLDEADNLASHAIHERRKEGKG
ncbi:hypothetical protein FC12_GL001570 [Lacticaseibacillus paracasei subsp. tolerans DSM 20258]|nr:hypothetical protein FC12_GL001570 [Lacticaseibacillus paracasei subsp. tolerans DSM 20258]MCT3364163.1 hypothetical protein [Lacticaseibacillus paracasei]GEL38180.1 hypothetical protein LPA06_10310 [Lacticaseibacillus paracasei subsp. tolerans]